MGCIKAHRKIKKKNVVGEADSKMPPIRFLNRVTSDKGLCIVLKRRTKIFTKEKISKKVEYMFLTKWYIIISYNIYLICMYLSAFIYMEGRTKN